MLARSGGMGTVGTSVEAPTGPTAAAKGGRGHGTTRRGAYPSNRRTGGGAAGPKPYSIPLTTCAVTGWLLFGGDSEEKYRGPKTTASPGATKTEGPKGQGVRVWTRPVQRLRWCRSLRNGR